MKVFLLPGAGSQVHRLLAHRPPLQNQAHIETRRLFMDYLYDDLRAGRFSD